MKPHPNTWLVAACACLLAAACSDLTDPAGPDGSAPGSFLRPAGHGDPVVATLDASGDTYVRDGAPNTSEGASPILRIRASGNNRVLVQFDPEEIEELLDGGTLVSAYLELDIYENANNWGPTGRPVDAHRLTRAWTEGNGKNADLPGPQQYRGDGPGATWNCATDDEVANQKPDCDGDEWEMGKPKMPELHPWVEAASASILVTNGLTGPVGFDVTSDVAGFLAGDHDHDGWLIRKRDEGPAGKVEFASREYVGEYASLDGPRLVITYIPPDLGPDGPVELGSLKDSFLRSGRANKNEGANPGLNLRADGDHRSLIAFDAAGIDTDGLTSATLVVTIRSNANNWGTTGRTIDAHTLLTDFTEGNGKNLDVVGPTDGSGAGVTWNCPTDTDVTNSAADCVAQWNGGTFGAATSPSALITNGLAGEVTFDVTADVLAGANKWLLKKTSEGAAGEVTFYSKEGATDAMDASLAPRLILNYGGDL